MESKTHTAHESLVSSRAYAVRCCC